MVDRWHSSLPGRRRPFRKPTLVPAPRERSRSPIVWRSARYAKSHPQSHVSNTPNLSPPPHEDPIRNSSRQIKEESVSEYEYTYTDNDDDAKNTTESPPPPPTVEAWGACSSGCGFLANSDRSFGSFCCRRCHRSFVLAVGDLNAITHDHGRLCERLSAGSLLPSTPVAHPTCPLVSQKIINSIYTWQIFPHLIHIVRFPWCNRSWLSTAASFDTRNLTHAPPLRLAHPCAFGLTLLISLCCYPAWFWAPFCYVMVSYMHHWDEH